MSIPSLKALASRMRHLTITRQAVNQFVDYLGDRLFNLACKAEVLPEELPEKDLLQFWLERFPKSFPFEEAGNVFVELYHCPLGYAGAQGFPIEKCLEEAAAKAVKLLNHELVCHYYDYRHPESFTLADFLLDEQLSLTNVQCSAFVRLFGKGRPKIVQNRLQSFIAGVRVCALKIEPSARDRIVFLRNGQCEYRPERDAPKEIKSIRTSILRM